MNPILKKLQFKSEECIFVLNYPPEFLSILDDISNYTSVMKEPESLSKDFAFVLIFVKSSEEIKSFARLIKDKLHPSSIIWFAYPKKSSKRYKTNISRDMGWDVLGDLSLEGVRQIAIDEDWSALRFRHISQIRNFKRDKKMALSDEGKKRTGNIPGSDHS